MKEKYCKNKFLNNLSKLPIIKNCIVDARYPPKELKELGEIINKTSLSSKLNINDVLLIQYISIFFAFLIGILLYLLKIKGLINISIGVILFIINAFIMFGFNFKFYIKFKARKLEIKSINSIPIINNYIVNMMKQGRLVSDILYQLISINTPYKQDFIKAYESFNKNPSEAFDFLISVFNESYIKETFKILKKSISYDEGTLIDSLEKINKLLIRQYKNNLKVREDKRLLNAEISLVIPFVFLAIAIMIPVAETVFNQIKTLNTI